MVDNSERSEQGNGEQKPSMDELTWRYVWDCERTAESFGEIVAQLELLVHQMSEALAAAQDKVTQLSLRIAAHALWVAVAAGRDEYDNDSLLKILERTRVVLAGTAPEKIVNDEMTIATRRDLVLLTIDGWFGNRLLQAHLSRPSRFSTLGMLHEKERSMCAAIDMRLQSNALQVGDEVHQNYSNDQLEVARLAIETWPDKDGKHEAFNNLLRCWGLETSDKRAGGTGKSGAVHPLAGVWQRARKKPKIGA